MTRSTLATVVALAAACGSSAPPSVHKASLSHESLTAKREFLERYVAFRRPYDRLDYSVRYVNNSGGCVPGPNEWDISLIAEVPESSLNEWTDGLSAVGGRPADAPVLTSAIGADSINEWFSGPNKVVGIDRQHRVVLYRTWTR